MLSNLHRPSVAPAGVFVWALWRGGYSPLKTPLYRKSPQVYANGMVINSEDLLKNAQQAQEHLDGINRKVSDIVVTGSAGGGMVEVDISGQRELLDIRIEPQILSPDNAQFVQDLIKSAYCDATDKIKGVIMSNMGSFLGDITSIISKLASKPS
jgi:DNA-binding YbaB/EbfC family protein